MRLATAELGVGGMHCGACANRVERALARLPAVTSASVNLATTHAFVAYDPTTLDVAGLCRAVEAIGFRAEEIHPGASAVAQERDDHLALRACIAWPLGLAALVISLVGSQTPGPAWAVLILAVLVELSGGWTFLRDAARQAARATTSMDTLVALGTLAAVSVNAVYVIALGGRHIHIGTGGGAFAARLHFAMAPLIVAVLITGRAVESAARRRATAALHSLMALRPPRARVVRHAEDEEGVLVPPESVPVGALVRVRANEAVPLDGTVVGGWSAVDESMLTGEPMPVERSQGATVIGGTRNGSGTLVVRVDAPAAESVLARLDRLVDDAQRDKPPLQRLADRVSGVFVPAVLLGAAATFLAWWFGVGNHDEAVLATLAMLLVACPCAMGLAAPVAIMVGFGRASALGILVRGGDALERLGRVDTVAFDKTGTLTERKAVVTDVIGLGGRDPADVLALAAAVEAEIDHPIAFAIAAATSSRPKATGVESVPGEGVSGLVDGARIGVHRLVPGEVTAALRGWAQEHWSRGETAVAVVRGEEPIGGIAVAARLRPEAADSVRRLHEMGLRTLILSGDSEPGVRAVAAAVGVDDERWALSPADKIEAVHALSAQGRRVMMVGDGVNDAPALAGADVGCVVGQASEAALARSDVALLGNDLYAVPGAITVARSTLAVMRENFAWAAGYNVSALPLAALGLIDPLVAAAAMALSSLLVVANSLRLAQLGRGGVATLRPVVRRRSVRGVAMSMALPVLLFAGLTVASQAFSPARGESLLPALPTISTVSLGEEGSAQVYLDPSAPGLNELHLFVFPTRPNARVGDVHVTVGRPERHLQPVGSVEVASNHYIQYVLLYPGTWIFHVDLEVGGHAESFEITRAVS